MLLGILCVGTASTLQAQDAEVRISRNLDRKLRRDAARLALRMRSGEDLRFQAVRIPERDLDAIYDALTTAYRQDEGVRAVFRCNVHTRPDPSIDHMLVVFDRDVDWAAPLREGRHETNSVMLNDLLYDHDLIIEKHVQWNDTEDAIAIRSKQPLNMANLANEFNNIEGVSHVDLGLAKEVGNDISAERVAGGWHFTFTLSFGSLVDKGEKIHTWQYFVGDDGQVTKRGEGGDPVPDWMRCEATLDRRQLLARR